MDEHDTPEILINPCNCKGTGAYVHVECVQKWINSKVKHKANQDSACSYWKHLICEVCKSTLPDLIDVNDTRIQLVPTVRPDTPYMLVERIFYDKSKSGENARMMVLLSLSNESSQLKLVRERGFELALLNFDKRGEAMIVISERMIFQFQDCMLI